MDYLDFELEIRSGEKREYPVTVRSSPAGETQEPETMRFPFDQNELTIRLKDLKIALLRSAASETRLIFSQEEQSVQDFGTELFNALIIGEVRSRYDASKAMARTQKKGMRIKMRIQAPELAALPWEFLYDPREPKYVCLSRNTPITRYLDLPQPAPPMAVSPPVRILGMGANPKGVPQLKVKKEMERINAAVKDLCDGGMIELVWMQGQTWRDLQNEMQRGPWHVFHFIGHGDFDPQSNEGGILLEDENGEAFILRASQLGLLLDGHYSLRLVLLNSCEGATASNQDVLSSTAATLMTEGIPAVLAMQYEITDTAAVEFSRSFYGAVANGLPIDAAVTEGRKSIKVVGGRTVEWGTPVLYMRSPDGNIFDVKQSDDEGRKRKKTADLFDEAQAAVTGKSWDVALQKLQSVTALEPAHKDACELLPHVKNQHELSILYSEGKKKYDQSDWAGALEFFKQISHREPDYRDVKALTADAVKQSQRVSFSMRLKAFISTALARAVTRTVLLVLAGLIVIGIAYVAWRRFRPTPPVGNPAGTDANQNANVTIKNPATVRKLVTNLIDESSLVFQPIEVAVSPDGSMVSFAGATKVISVRRDGDEFLGESATSNSICVVFSPNSEIRASGHENGDIRLWSVNSSDPIKVLDGKAGRVFALSFSKDSQSIMSASEESNGIKTLRGWRIGDRVELFSVETAAEEIVLAINAERKLAVVRTSGGELQLWALGDDGEKRITTFYKVEDTVTSATFTLDGSLLAVGEESGVVRVWKTGADTPARTIESRRARVGGIAFSADGQTLAIGWNDGTLGVWSQLFSERELSTEFATKKGAIVSLSLDGKGEMLAEGRAGSSIRLWTIKQEEVAK